MKSLFFLIVICTLVGCSNSKRIGIQYEYNGIVVTRFDKDAESRFYYGRLNKEDSSMPYVYAKYAGFDGSMDGYLVFKNDKTVELVPLMYFVENGNPSKLSLKEYNNNTLLNAWQDSIKGRYDNVVRISDNLNIERQRNAENYSNVNVKYSR
ncbi:hypothetical protein ACFOET_08285 [Parapedobacter deserti]|uniref:Lipoprotein n=1 Tax=Parapedobacter deserti TaxID=1912957 RepID=A0ABV7JQM5_9SPHI